MRFDPLDLIYRQLSVFLDEVGMGLGKNRFFGCILIITGPASEF